MKKPLLLSLATAALICTNLSAESTMYERFEAMEREMNQLKQEIATLKAQKESIQDEEAEDESESEAVASDDAGEDADVVASADEGESDEDDEYIPTTEDRLFDIEESIAELNRNTSGSHLKFNVDYRFAIENMSYEMANGRKAENDAFMTNRLWIDMGYKATNNLSFIGQLAYNKAFGERSGASDPASASFEGFDWIANENAYDDKIRVRSAYFLWQDQEFFGLDIPWTFSIGRRPSTNGALINLRDDDHASSPIGHAINVEFDGLSSQFTLNKEWGTSVKLCLGRGMSNAAPKFTSTPYTDVDKIDGGNSNIDLAGLIFTPYEDRQYKISSMYYYASNLIDAVNPMDYTQGFDTVGGMHSGVVYASVKGIGDGWSDFLDYTTVFASFAVSQTDPKEGQSMLGSTESEVGTSFWIGTQFPSLISDYGKWGVEYNHGSKYWRSITYGEDTNIGSKVAARGDAYEVYFTEYLVEDILSLQLRYTYIDYKYSGSNGFFGGSADGSTGTGTPFKISDNMGEMGRMVVDNAQDIRLYIRYKY
ncbi:DUF3373 family protein [Sulfurimonas crateris]|uniref:DUF3373 family protein n=1 Tax=Sulfurimonas crateris TaxID=2574727 RepID=A0A4U2Z2W7_9BACT|nr:DUF3373 family protein [Sulfurimonas crateris]TKI68419.1 DUF3373 family protein [Sulfurimonas crateris]